MDIIRQSITSLRRTGVLDRDVAVDADLVLLGTGSVLDSLAFVTFITDMEDRLNAETEREYFLMLDDIHSFNTENRNLSAKVLAQFIARLTSGESDHQN